MKKLYEIVLNEVTAEEIMLRTEMGGECQSLVDKLAEVVDVIPNDCNEVTVELTADELYECFKRYRNICEEV